MLLAVNSNYLALPKHFSSESSMCLANHLPLKDNTGAGELALQQALS